MEDSYIPNTMTEFENSQNIADKFFKIYDTGNKGYLNDNEIRQMMQDTYKSINKAFNPSEYDIETMKKTLDFDGNGKVDKNDVQKMIEKLMCYQE